MQAPHILCISSNNIYMNDEYIKTKKINLYIPIFTSQRKKKHFKMIPRIKAPRLTTKGQIRSVQTQTRRSGRIYSQTSNQDSVIMQVSTAWSLKLKFVILIVRNSKTFSWCRLTFIFGTNDYFGSWPRFALSARASIVWVNSLLKTSNLKMWNAR